MISQSLPVPLLQKIVRRIHGESELDGCMIGYTHMGQQRLLHKGVIPTRNMLEKFVMVEHLPLPQGTKSAPAAVQSAVRSNISRFGPEVIGVGCSLMCFAFSAGALTVGAGLTPETGPVGAVVGVAGWVGLTSAGVQTYNGVARLWQIAVDPYGHELSEWDKKEYYSNTLMLVDFLGCVSSVAAVGAAAPALYKILAARGSLQNVTPAMLKAMDKSQREMVLKKAYDQITSSPGGREDLAAAMRAAKISFQGYSKANHSGKVSGVISAAAQRRLRLGIIEELQGAVGPGFSMVPAAFAGSASGYVNQVVTTGSIDPGIAWLWGVVNVHVLQRKA